MVTHKVIKMKSKHILPMVLGVLLIGIVVGVFVLNEDVSFTDLFSKSFFGLTGKVIWENADADAFGNGTYYNTTWDSGVGAVVLLNGSMECPDNQGYNSTTRVNMTGNILLLHMNGGGGVQELPNNQANSWMDMSNNIILLHMDDDNWGDSSGNENNGSTGGEATFVSPGKLGSHAGIFDGVNDFVNLFMDNLPAVQLGILALGIVIYGVTLLFT